MKGIFIIAIFLISMIESNAQLYFSMITIDNELHCDSSLIELNELIRPINTLNLGKEKLESVGDIIDFASLHYKLKGITFLTNNSQPKCFVGINLDCNLDKNNSMRIIICFNDGLQVANTDMINIVNLIKIGDQINSALKDDLDSFFKYFLLIRKISKFSYFQSKVPKPFEVPEVKKKYR